MVLNNTRRKMEEDIKIITMFIKPNRFNKAPYGTICKVAKNDRLDDFNIYIQISDIEDEYIWQPIEKVISEALKYFHEDPKFIKFCLDIIKTCDFEKIYKIKDIIY